MIPTDSSSNNQMIVLPIIHNLGRLKKIRPKRPTKIGRNDPGPKRPRPKRPRPKQPRAETTQGRNDWADAGLCLFYKIIHGIVAVLLPDHVQYSDRVSRYYHSMTFRQVSSFRDYYKYSFFSLSIVQWNAFPESVAYLLIFEAFKTAAAVCSMHTHRSMFVCLFFSDFR